MKRRVTAALCSAALTLAAAAPLTGCYGSFALTKKLYHWNGGLGNKFAETAVLWAFIIIPVYPLATLGDFVIFNLIEFWSGKNPVAGPNGAPPEIRGLADGTLEIRHGDAVYTLCPLDEERFEIRAGARVLAEGRVDAAGGLVLKVAGRADEIRLGRDELGQVAARMEAAGLVAVR